jgi:2-keto-4-pentenoate hydratase/2-oxohepta-3-ene-1,7-dioic acid hydratase in catechol pathway
MKFVTFKAANGKTGPGLLTAEGVVDLSAKYADVLSIIRGGASVDASGPVLPLSKIELLAPIQNPPRIFCVGLNYRDHAIESKMEIPKVPTIFFKLNSALTGDKSAIKLPAASAQVDYEAEFAVVIGKEARNVSKENWQEYVFGYTILNDVSARDVQLSTSQWSLGKSFDTFAPLGPSIVTKDEIADPHALQISLLIDGEVLQNSNTRELIFKVPDLIAYISAIAPLQPGDIISTGTPQGVGLGRTPQRWLKPGETVAVTIDGLGTLTNPVA